MVVSTQTADDTEVNLGPPSTERAKSAHIVKTQPGESAVAKVYEARMYGTAIEALCGEVFVPSQDPLKLPKCDKCVEIYELYRMENPNLNEGPAS